MIWSSDLEKLFESPLLGPAGTGSFKELYEEFGGSIRNAIQWRLGLQCQSNTVTKVTQR